MKSAARFAPAGESLADLPRRIFLDSCTAQTLRRYGGAIHEGELVPESDRIYRIPDGIANVEALASIFRLNERALFEWIVSDASLKEAFDKHDRQTPNRHKRRNRTRGRTARSTVRTYLHGHGHFGLAIQVEAPT